MVLSRRHILQISAAAAASSVFPIAAPAQEMFFFKIGTASTASSYFPVGTLLANAISNPPGSRACDVGGNCGVPNLIAVAESTPGAVYNVQAVVGKSLDAVICQADVAYHAFEGTGPFQGQEPLTGLRALASLFPVVIHLATRTDGGLRTVESLKGKRIGVGPVGSGTRFSAELVLEAWGLSNSVKRNEAPLYQEIDALKAQELDALFLVDAVPSQSMSDLAKQQPIQLLPLQGQNADRMIAESPQLSPYYLLSGRYHSVPAVETIQVPTLWLVSEDMSESIAYGLTRALWHQSRREVLDSGHISGHDITFETALEGLSVPLHRGARRYYQEREVL